MRCKNQWINLWWKGYIFRIECCVWIFLLFYGTTSGFDNRIDKFLFPVESFGYFFRYRWFKLYHIHFIALVIMMHANPSGIRRCFTFGYGICFWSCKCWQLLVCLKCYCPPVKSALREDNKRRFGEFLMMLSWEKRLKGKLQLKR